MYSFIVNCKTLKVLKFLFFPVLYHLEMQGDFGSHWRNISPSVPSNTTTCLSVTSPHIAHVCRPQVILILKPLGTWSLGKLIKTIPYQWSTGSLPNKPSPWQDFDSNLDLLYTAEVPDTTWVATLQILNI